MAFLVGAALLFPSDLCAHISECFHFRKEEYSGASRQTSKAAMQGSSQFWGIQNEQEIKQHQNPLDFYCHSKITENLASWLL